MQTIHIKGMVCHRCILSVQDLLKKHRIPYINVELGRVLLTKELSEQEYADLNTELHSVGFEFIESRQQQLIENIKIQIELYLQSIADSKKQNLSEFIKKAIPYDYNYVSELFSKSENKTIEHYFIEKRIEKIKELLKYEVLNLTEIAYQLGFSSVQHMSTQFKKATGSSPSQFRKLYT